MYTRSKSRGLKGRRGPSPGSAPAKGVPNGAPSLFRASSFTMCLDREVLEGTLPWRTRYP